MSESSGWVSVQEEDPPSGEWLILSRAGLPMIIGKRDWISAGNSRPDYLSPAWIGCGGLRILGDVTHWQPLPAPPASPPTKDEALREAVAWADSVLSIGCRRTFGGGYEVSEKDMDALDALLASLRSALEGGK